MLKTTKSQLAGMAISLLVLVLPFLSGANSVVVKSGALVTQFTGAGQVITGGKASPLRAKQVIAPGQRIKTGANGRVELTFADGSRLRVGPVSDILLVRYDAAKKQTVAQINQGKAWNSVTPGANKKVILKGRHATCAVMGTTYSIDVSVDITTSTVFKGNVGVSRPMDFTEDNLDQMIEKTPKVFAPSAPPSAPSSSTHGPTVIANPVHEIAAPMRVIPGPYEVSYDQWLQIIENQQISMGDDGKANVTEINPQALAQQDEWVRWNQEQDHTPPQFN